MKCPYCGDSSHVIEVGIPTVALLQTYAIALGFGALSVAAAAAMAAIIISFFCLWVILYY